MKIGDVAIKKHLCKINTVPEMVNVNIRGQILYKMCVVAGPTAETSITQCVKDYVKLCLERMLILTNVMQCAPASITKATITKVKT